MAHLLCATTTSAFPHQYIPTQQTLSCELLDSLSEALASPPDEHHSRASSICSLVQEMYATVAWLNGENTDVGELASLQLVVVAAREHLDRMSRITDWGQRSA